MTRAMVADAWADWNKALIAAVLGVVLGAGALALAVQPMVHKHESMLVEQAAIIDRLRDDASQVKEDVAVIRAVVERMERGASGR